MEDASSADYELVDTIDVGEPEMPQRVAANTSGVWVTIEDGTVLHIDAERGSVVDTIDVGSEALAITATDEDVWVAGGDDGAILSRIDPETSEVTDTIPLSGEDPHDIVVDGDRAIWVTGQEVVWRIDPVSRRVVAEIHGGSPVGITASEGAIWVASNDDLDGTVSRVDPSIDAVTDVISIGGDAVSVAATGNVVWVTNPGGGEIVGVDSETLDVMSTVDVGTDPTWVAAAGDALWVTGSDDGTVTLVDASLGEVVRSFDVGTDPYGVTTFADDVWVVNRGDGTLSQLSPRS